MKTKSPIGTLVCTLFLVSPLLFGAERELILAPPENPTHQFDEIVPGVFHVSGTGRVYTMSNSMVIVGKQDCILVDTHVSQVAADALVEALKTITDKPIGQVIITHFHFDHAHGTQIFDSGIPIIGHEFTRGMLAGDIWNKRTFKGFTESIPHRVGSEKRNSELLAFQALESL